MAEFTKAQMAAVKNRNNYKFYEIYKNDKSFFKEFTDSLTQQKDKDALAAIYAQMDAFGPNLLNSTIVNHIRGGKHDRNDVYEFKKENIRIYFILERPNVLVLLGGFKSKGKQQNDTQKVFRHFNTLPSINKIPDYDTTGTDEIKGILDADNPVGIV